jgi:hypothetical protein
MKTHNVKRIWGGKIRNALAIEFRTHVAVINVFPGHVKYEYPDLKAMFADGWNLDRRVVKRVSMYRKK